MQCTSYSCAELRRIAARAHHQPCGGGGPLQDGEKHRRLGFFGEFPVLSVLRNTYHLYASSIRHLEVATDRVFGRTKDLTRKLLVHYSDARRIFIVVPSESAAGEQRGALGMKVFGRYVVHVDVSGGIRWPQIRRSIAKDIRAVLGI